MVLTSGAVMSKVQPESTDECWVKPVSASHHQPSLWNVADVPSEAERSHSTD